MRPLRLSFSGIRRYPGAVGPLDFTGKKLIAIIGDTGAGKSTLLEAITLALYGTCTWSDLDNKALMAEGAAQMAVDFTFAHDGQHWRVRRTYHANRRDVGRATARRLHRPVADHSRAGRPGTRPLHPHSET
jgi:exonuclease SbcC